MAKYRIDTAAAPIDWENTDFTARTLQNAKNLLRLKQGELPYDRLRGLDARVWDASLPKLRAALPDAVRLALGWEPDITFVSCDFIKAGDGTTVIRAVVDVTEEEA
jgi:hypothetical protein